MNDINDIIIKKSHDIIPFDSSLCGTLPICVWQL